MYENLPNESLSQSQMQLIAMYVWVNESKSWTIQKAKKEENKKTEIFLYTFLTKYMSLFYVLFKPTKKRNKQAKQKIP